MAGNNDDNDNFNERLVGMLRTGIGLQEIAMVVHIPTTDDDSSSTRGSNSVATRRRLVPRRRTTTPRIHFSVETVQNDDTDKFNSENNRDYQYELRNSAQEVVQHKHGIRHRFDLDNYQDLIDWIERAFPRSHNDGDEKYHPTRDGDHLQIEINPISNTDLVGHDVEHDGARVGEDNHYEDVEVADDNVDDEDNEVDQDDQMTGNSLWRLIDILVWLANWRSIDIAFYGFRRGEGDDLFIKNVIPTFLLHSASSLITSSYNSGAADENNGNSSATVCSMSFSNSRVTNSTGFVFPPSLNTMFLVCNSSDGDKYGGLQISEDPTFYSDRSGAGYKIDNGRTLTAPYGIVAHLIARNLLDPFVESFFGDYDRYFDCEDGAKAIALASSFSSSLASSHDTNYDLMWEGEKFYNAVDRIDGKGLHDVDDGGSLGSESKQTAKSASSLPLLLPQFGANIIQIVLYGDFDFATRDFSHHKYEADMILNKLGEWLLPSTCPKLQSLTFRHFQTEEHMAKVVNFIASVDESAFTELYLSFDYDFRAARQMFGGHEISKSNFVNHFVQLVNAIGLCNRGSLRTVTIDEGEHCWDHDFPVTPSSDVAAAAKDAFRKALKKMLVNNLNIKKFDIKDYCVRQLWYQNERVIYEEMCHPLSRFRSLVSCLDRYHPSTMKLWSLFITHCITSITHESNSANDAAVVPNGSNHDRVMLDEDSSLDSDDRWERYDKHPPCGHTVVFELIRDYVDFITAKN